MKKFMKNRQKNAQKKSEHFDSIKKRPATKLFNHLLHIYILKFHFVVVGHISVLGVNHLISHFEITVEYQNVVGYIGTGSGELAPWCRMRKTVLWIGCYLPRW